MLIILDQVRKVLYQSANFSRITFLFLLFLIVCSCNSKKDQTQPEIQVVTTKPQIQTIKLWDEYRNRLESPESVEVRSRVSGIIVEVPFVEGSLVNKETLLYVIDEKPFQAEVNSKLANLQKQKALALRKSEQMKRFEKLKADNAISPDEYDQIEADYRESKANVDIAAADLENAKLNLQWARIYSPITGKVGKKLLTIGNLVGSSVLTTVNSVNPMYISIFAPESKIGEYANIKKEYPQGLPCEIKSGNERSFNIKGLVNFVDNHVNQKTGTIEFRCSIPNEDGKLSTGEYADVRILVKSATNAVLIPNQSISTDQNKKYIFLVNAKNEVERKDVSVQKVFGKFSMILESLSENDNVVTSGLQKIKAGQKVKFRNEEVENFAVE